MCTSPVFVGRTSYPCGRCDECRQAEEYKLGLVGVANLNEYHDVFSVTFTYDDENIPLCVKSIVVDYSQGCYFLVDHFVNECSSVYSSRILTPEGLRDIWRSRDKDDTLGCVLLSKNLYNYRNIQEVLVDLRKNYFYAGTKTHEELFYGDYFNSPFVEIYSVLCPVADITHVQKWLKRFRETHFRYTGVRPDISYTGVAEYGPLRCRPHFHLCIFANDIDVDLLRSFVTAIPYQGVQITGVWRYGNSVLKHADKSDLCYARNMSKYVAKYGKKQDKGIHLLEALHVVPSFRRITSKGYYDPIKKFVQKTILRDIPFQKYMDVLDDAYIPCQDEELDCYAQIISNRLKQKYSLCGKQFFIPRSFVSDILTKTYSYEYSCAGLTIDGEKIVYETTRIRCQKSVLWQAVNYFEGVQNLESLIRECWKMSDEYGCSFYSAFDEITRLQSVSAYDRDRDHGSNIVKRYKDHAVI